MLTIYVYRNSKLGDNGEQYEDALIDQHDAPSEEECFKWFFDNYNSNDYTASFCAP